MKKDAKLVGIILLIGAVIFGSFFWMVFFYPAWFVPTKSVAYGALVPAIVGAACLDWHRVRLFNRLPYKLSNADTPLKRVGFVLFLTWVFWTLFAQSIPAAFTDAVGQRIIIKDRVGAYYRSTTGCGRRLVLQQINPVLGGYCRAGRSAKDFSDGDIVLIEGYQSELGLHVKRFERGP